MICASISFGAVESPEAGVDGKSRGDERVDPEVCVAMIDGTESIVRSAILLWNFSIIFYCLPVGLVCFVDRVSLDFCLCNSDISSHTTCRTGSIGFSIQVMM